MALIRQDKVDQGARLGRLESYVYSFHGQPRVPGNPGQPTTPGGGVQPPIGGKPPIVAPPANKPPVVPGQTPILSNGAVPFTGTQYFYAGLDISGKNPGIKFSETKYGQVISGTGTKHGTWAIGRLDPKTNVVSIHNNTKGGIGGKIDLDPVGKVTINDFLHIDDKRPGGGKDTISLNSYGMCNVGIDFCRDGEPVWEIYKTGKDKLEIGHNHKNKYKSALSINKDRIVHFDKVPSASGTPMHDNDFVTVKFMNNTINSGTGGSSSIVDLGKPARIKNSLELYGAGKGLLQFTTNTQQTIEGKTKVGSWTVGKYDATSNSVKFENVINGTKTFIKLSQTGEIKTSNKLTVGDVKDGDVTLTLESNLKTHKNEIIMKDSTGVKASIAIVNGQLVITSTEGDILFNLEANKNMVVNNRSKLSNVLTSQNGPTGHRPTHGLLVGDVFFDTTLSLPVWVKSTNPAVWINSMGKIV